MKYFLFLFITFTSFLFSNSKEEKIFYIDNLRVIENPTMNSPSYIPKDFIPEEAQFNKYFELDSFSIEAGLFIQTNLSREELIVFYESSFKKNDWRIFRKDIQKDSMVYQVENVSKRVISIIIRNVGSVSMIKLFYKRSR
jgi:hypothetical protein